MSDDLDKLGQYLRDSWERARPYRDSLPKPITSLHVSRDGKSVDLTLDTSQACYGEWIKGEGGDISLHRNRETEKVNGAHLPLYSKTLMIGGDGLPDIRIDLESGKMFVDEDTTKPAATEPEPEVSRLRKVQSKQAKKIRGLKDAVRQKEKVLRRRSEKLRECMARLKAINGDQDEFRTLIAEKEQEIKRLASQHASAAGAGERGA